MTSAEKACPAIEARDLRKIFPAAGGQRAVRAVRGVTLSVERGEIFGFLGPNGAGKTTCQRMLTTLLPIDGGSAAIAGYDVKENPRAVRRHIGYVGQLGGADLPATGRENLMLAGRLYGLNRADVKRRIGEAARLMDIEELLDRIVRTYSGGQRRRLEIALSMIHQPDVLFMDEPTTGLDPQNRAHLWAHIRLLRERGTTVFLTTHYLEEADALADRLAIIDRGRIVASGTPRALKKQIAGDVIQMKLKTGAAEVPGALAALDFVNEWRVDGQTASLYVADGAAALPVLFELLKERNIGLEAISLSEPTLDDVFLKQTGRYLSNR